MNTSDIRYLVNTLDPKGIPVVTPAGVLGGHLDAMKFCEHIPQEEYPAGALAAALYLCSGVRGMERGTVSSVRDENGKEILADVELVRLACPRRVFTLSQIKYVIDRLECRRRYCSMEYHVCRCDNFNCPDFDCLLLL